MPNSYRSNNCFNSKVFRGFVKRQQQCRQQQQQQEQQPQQQQQQPQQPQQCYQQQQCRISGFRSEQKHLKTID